MNPRSTDYNVDALTTAPSRRLEITVQKQIKSDYSFKGESRDKVIKYGVETTCQRSLQR